MPSAIEIQDKEVTYALQRLQSRLTNMSPVMRALGEGITARTKQRFDTATDPDGIRWKANSQATIEAFVYAKGGVNKKGITKKGQSIAISKKPLTGHTGDLKRQIFYDANNDGLLVFSTMAYAAMQHYGGAKAQFPHLWGDIPSRRIFPISTTGELSATERQNSLEILRSFLDS